MKVHAVFSCTLACALLALAAPARAQHTPDEPGPSEPGIPGPARVAPDDPGATPVEPKKTPPSPPAVPVTPATPAPQVDPLDPPDPTPLPRQAPKPDPGATPAKQPAVVKDAPKRPRMGFFLGASLLWPTKNGGDIAVELSPGSGGSFPVTVATLRVPEYPLRLLAGYRYRRLLPYLMFSLDHRSVEQEIQPQENVDDNFTTGLGGTSFLIGAGTRFHIWEPVPDRVTLYALGELFLMFGFASTDDSRFDELSDEQRDYIDKLQDRINERYKWFGFRLGVGGEVQINHHLGIGVDGGLLYLLNFYSLDYEEVESVTPFPGPRTILEGESSQAHALNWYAALNINIYF